MKVIIVAKTRMGSGACVGGLTFDGRSVRLIAADADINDHFNLEYNIGDVWDVDFRAQDTLLPPHVENIVVQSKRKMPPVQNVAPLIEQHMPPLSGGLDMLFEGLTAHTKAGALYICERFGVPAASTMFWRPDRPLVRDDDGKRIRYRYPTADNGRTLTFVGSSRTTIRNSGRYAAARFAGALVAAGRYAARRTALLRAVVGLVPGNGRFRLAARLRRFRPART